VLASVASRVHADRVEEEMRVTRRAVASVVLPTLPGFAGGWVEALPSEKDDGIRLRTEQFTLYGHTGQSRIQKIGSGLEELREQDPPDSLPKAIDEALRLRGD